MARCRVPWIFQRVAGHARWEARDDTQNIHQVGCLDPDLGEHNRIIRFLEGLRDQIPMLLMGSQVLVDLGNRQHHHVLRGIEPEAANLLFASEKLHALSEADKATVLSLTRGNPALMRMFALLHHTGEPVEISLKRIADDPSAEAMLYRVFEHLSATEQRTLSALSVFREAAPRDAWEQSEDQGSLDSLIRYGLAHPDLTGGIEVAPFARTFVLKRMPRDVRADHSRRAGEAMAARGSHTSAAVYFAEAGDIPKSIRLWAAHWEAEVSRGNGAIALDLFGNIAREKEKLDVEDQRMLALLLADLLTANGHPGKSIERINDVSWPEDHPLSPYAFRLRGTAYRDRNQTQAALEQYTTALEILTKPPLVQRVYLHCRRGYVYELQLSDFAAARLDANLARLDAANFMGNVEEADGNFESARQHYTDALAICKSIQAVEACEIQAHHCHSNLSRLAWRQDRLAEAFEHIQLALAISKKAGWLTAELVDRINLSAAHLIASQPEQALAIAEDALRDAADIENNYIVSGLCSNAAEACFLLGRIDEAEHYADRVIRMKEPDRTPNALLVLGKVFRARKLHTNLVATLEQAIKAALDGGDQYTCGAAWCELGDVYFDTDDREHALKCWKESLSIFQQLGNDRQCRALGQRMQQC